MKFFKELDQWWFGKSSPVAFGLFRILIGGNALLSLLSGLPDFEAWYTDKGYVPLWASKQYLGEVFWRFTLLPEYFATNPSLTLAFYLLVTLAALFTTVGLWTRISSIILAVGIVSLHHRNAMILHSGDSLMRLLLIYVAAGPSGAACSLDRLIGLWKGRAPTEPPLVSLWAQRLVQIQVSLVYFTTLWWKWYGLRWKDGTATWFPSQLTEFYRFPVPEFMDRQPFVAATTYGTMVAEFAMGVLVFYRPLRKWALVLGVLLHLGIEYRMNIPFFASVILAGYVCYYDGDEVSSWAKRLGLMLKKLQFKVFLPRDYELRPGPGDAVRAFDPLGLVKYEPGKEEGLTAVAASGKPSKPVRGAWMRSVGAWIIGPFLFRKLLLSALFKPEIAETRLDKSRKKAVAKTR